MMLGGVQRAEDKQRMIADLHFRHAGLHVSSEVLDEISVLEAVTKTILDTDTE